MKTLYSPAELNQKERARREINAQIDAFLRNGGKISVISITRRDPPTHYGTTWHGHEEPQNLIN